MIAEPLFSPRILMKKLLGTYFPSLVWSPEDAAKVNPMSKPFTKMLVEGGYFHIQATKPDTVGEFCVKDTVLLPNFALR